MRILACGMWLLVAALGCTGQKPLEVPHKQDVVLLILCTARADQMSGWGSDVDTTPYLASKVAQGVRFERTISQAPWTRPASAAIITGRNPAQIGLIEPLDGRNERPLHPDVVTLAETMKTHGYATLGITANPNLNSHFGFDQGFDAYLETSPLMRDGGVKHLSPRVALDLIPELNRVPGTQGVFIQAMLVDAHRPFIRKAQYLEPFKDETVPKDVVAYRAALRRLDNGLEGLIQRWVSERPSLANALWVVVGDHGEGLGYPRHHGSSHGTSLYPSATHVPWGMWGPGIASNTVMSGLSAQIDVVPTILGMNKLSSEMEWVGKDHSSRIRKGGGDSGRQRVFTATWFRWVARAAVYTPNGFCQRDFNPSATAKRVMTGAGSSVQYPFPDGCFDLEKDPELRSPLLDSAMDEELKAWYLGQMDAFTSTKNPQKNSLPSDIDAQLKALGYAE